MLPIRSVNFVVFLRCDFLLVVDMNEWIRYDCSDEGIHILRTFVTHLLVHIHQKTKIALEIAAKIASRSLM